MLATFCCVEDIRALARVRRSVDLGDFDEYLPRSTSDSDST